MKPKLLLVLLLITGIAYFLYFREGPERVRVGDPAPSLTLPARNGKAISLQDLRGRAVLINFWATWCPPCREEMPSLERLKTRFDGKNFELLAVSVDEEGGPAIDRFLKKVPVTMTILLDPQGETAARYGTYRLPESFLIDKNGILVKRYLGPRDWTDPEIVAEIEKYAN